MTAVSSGVRCEPLVFSFEWHWTEIAPEAAIPLDDPLQAL